jgi:hypothetical protein
MRKIYWWTCAALAIGLGACKSEGTTGAADGKSGEAASSSAASKPKLSGRCENETTDSPYGSLYFYPEKKELFVTHNGFAARYPLLVTKEDETRTDFTYKSKVDDVVETDVGAFSWVGTEKWRFDGGKRKDSICRPVDDTLFYKSVSSLGIKPGKYLDAQRNLSLEILADAQKMIVEEQGRTKLLFYRVRSQSPDSGLTLYADFGAPSDSTSSLWPEWTLTTVGDSVLLTLGTNDPFRLAPVK